MKYVYQKRTDDCVSACLASILDLDIDEVPYFYENRLDGKMWNRVNEWLDKKNMHLLWKNQDHIDNIQRDAKNAGYGMIIIHHQDSPSTHAFVSYNGLLFHEPSGEVNTMHGFDKNKCYHMYLLRK